MPVVYFSAGEMGIFSLRFGKNLGVLALGMVPFIDTTFIMKKKLLRVVLLKIDTIKSHVSKGLNLQPSSVIVIANG
jgi:hypothetical protein